jgi:hypothetical protein
MSVASTHQKHFSSARKRFLSEALGRFCDEHFPGRLAPLLRDRFAAELVAFFERQALPTSHLRPGQCLWNAVPIDTRADHPKVRFLPVLLTLVNEQDVLRLAAGVSFAQVRAGIVARLLEEAYQQGALLSMRDLSLLVWIRDSQLLKHRRTWEQETGRLLPHPGTLQDMGTCLSHKTSIVTKVVYQHQDPRQVASATRHSQHAVDRYVKAFHRVRTCYRQRADLDFVCLVTGMSRHLVSQYVEIIEQFEKPETPSLTGNPA